jgi:hypothetical protein
VYDIRMVMAESASSAICTFVAGVGLQLPSGAGPYWAPAAGQSGFARHTEEITVQVPIQRLDQWRRSRPLENTLRGTKRIAGVARTEMIRGTWDEVGARRHVILNDGSQTTEEVLEVTRPSLFRYEVWGFTNWARLLTDCAVGEFQYREMPGGTAVKWTYSFHQRSLLAAPLLSWVVQTDFAEFMRSALQTMKQQSENDCRTKPAGASP